MGRATQHLEQELWEKGAQFVAGVDEAGRGAWAGPLVAACVVMPAEPRLKRIHDSKLIPEAKREPLFVRITETALDWAVGVVSVEEIDLHGVHQANAEAMRRALRALTLTPHHVLADGKFGFDFQLPTTWVVEGDAKSYAIACASILAKVTRDRLMIELHDQFPQYGFHEHKGYGTPAHQTALHEYGITPVHRKSFAPIFSLAGS